MIYNTKQLCFFNSFAMFPFVLVGFCVILSVAANPLVTIPNGVVQGTIHTSFKNDQFYGFHAIPYAKPPTGSLRFQAPQPAEAWSGTLDATKEGHCCYQVKSDSAAENEDCLFVNVFTPTNITTKLPVMFWIYGGAYRGGAAAFDTYGPDYFMEQGIIVVTHNYRVGPFGFLSTGDTVIPGNAGLKDQSLALKWTYDNIEYFGGDPNQIVIFGESAGSSSVGYQLLNKNNEGLFKGAIQQSGSPLNEWSLIKNPKDYAIDIVKQIDSSLNLQDSTKILEYLQSIPASKIDAASKLTTPALTLPVVEVEHSGAFITKGPYELYESGDFVQVPLIIGTNSEEEVFLLQSSAYVRGLGAVFDANLETVVPSYFNLKSGKTLAEVGKNIKNIYLTDDQTFAGNIGATIRYYSDNSFTRGVIKEGLLISQYTDVYFYVFSYDGEMGGWNKSTEGAEKVMHGEDIYYIWARRGSHSNQDLSKYPESDVRTHERFIKMWSDFAKHLNPTPQKSELVDVTWEKFDGEYRYLDIDTDLEMKTNPKTSFLPWQNVFETDADKPYVTY